MYNYSLLNNAIRLFLISQAPQCCNRTNTHIYILTHLQYTTYVLHQFVISERCAHTKHAHPHFSWEARVK